MLAPTRIRVDVSCVGLTSDGPNEAVGTGMVEAGISGLQFACTAAMTQDAGPEACSRSASDSPCLLFYTAVCMSVAVQHLCCCKSHATLKFARYADYKLGIATTIIIGNNGNINCTMPTACNYCRGTSSQEKPEEKASSNQNWT